MTMQKIFTHLLVFLGIFFILPSYAQNVPGQTLQINTRFTKIYGKPTWLLIVRDVDSGKVSPYIYDIRDNDNYWIAFTYGHSYRITASSLSFGPYAKIKNFCNLENGVISGESYWIYLTGEMSPDTHRFQCHVEKHKDMPLPIANTQ